MKISISSMGDTLNSKVSEQFGRCPYFLIIDSETMEFKSVPNPGIKMMGGAGPEAVRLISSYNAKVILTGAVGPNAQAALNAAGIKIVTGFQSDAIVKDVVEKYINNKEQNNGHKK